MRMEKVGGNRKRVPTVSCLRHVCLSEEEMRSSREEVVIFRLKIRSKIANVVKGNGEKVKGGVKTLFLGWIPVERSHLGTFLVPSPEGDIEVGVGVAIVIS